MSEPHIHVPQPRKSRVRVASEDQRIEAKTVERKRQKRSGQGMTLADLLPREASNVDSAPSNARHE